MRNNTQWFESPKPTAFGFTHPPHPPQHFPDLAQIHPAALTPTLAHHPLSPFHAAHTHHPDHAPHPEHPSAIRHLVVFSEEEEEATPEGQPAKRNEDILTTGRKSSVQRPAKKRRPKDKGLRGLSLKALQTVVAMGEGSYKAVAGRLLAGLEGEEGRKSANEETNIKRRVYDALNVLISLGLLRKQGRLIVADHPAPPLDPALALRERSRLASRLALKEFVLEEKRDKLRETQEKRVAVEGLFRRNQRDHHLLQQSAAYVPFPFVGVLAADWTTTSFAPHELELRFPQLVHPFGDIDSLRSLQQHFQQ